MSLITIAGIAKIADITTIVEGLLTLWSSFKGIVEKNKRINDIIYKSIEKAKKRVRDRDWFDKPILISNTDVLRNILLKANNEDISISDALTKDVFNDIYDEIIQDKEFWEVLQALLTEHRLQIIECRGREIQESSVSIHEKVDEVIAQIKAVVIAIEKTNLSIDELRPYYPLDKELFINEEENRKLYRDEVLIEKIHQNLDSKHVYLIQSSEGRGKTTLCRIIASDYYSQDTKVYFIDLKSNVGIDAIRRCCIELYKTKVKTLLVLENIHASIDLEALVSLINSYRKDLDNQLYFLLNARPTESEYATYLKDLGEDNIFDLRPFPEYCKGVARCLCKDKPISEGDLSSFISKRIYSILYTNQQNAGANLRLLRIYCSVWNDGNYGSILDIKEHDILEKFKSTYELRTASRSKKNALLYLSCMYQFDVPLQEELLTDEEFSELQGFYSKGLCTFFDGKFYLPHSVDASCLTKAISGKQYISDTQKKVLDFVKRILNAESPSSYEGDFILIYSGLVNRYEEFKTVLNQLTNWDIAAEIITKVSPGFVLAALDTRNQQKRNILDNYNDNKDLIKNALLKARPMVLNSLNLEFKKYMDINILYDLDLFENVEEFNLYLESHIFKFNRSFRSNVAELGFDYIKCYDSWRERTFPESENVAHFSFRAKQKAKKNRTRISNKWVRNTFHRLSDEEKNNRLENIKDNGFNFDDLWWRWLGKFVNEIIVFKSKKPNCDELCKTIVKEIISEVLVENKKSKCIAKATTKELSLFYSNVSKIDKELYGFLVQEEDVVSDATTRLNKGFNYTQEELYFFSHFYPQEWCKTTLNDYINKANEEQQILVLEWHDKAMKSLCQKGITMENNSLLDYIHKRFVEEKQ